mgnify:CR=1 FL=1
MTSLTFDRYQEFTKSTAIYDHFLYPVLGLAEEAGEVAGKYAKAVRDNTDFPVEDIKKELGDVLWMLTRVCDDMGFTLQEVAELNRDKLMSRQQRGTLGGSGDDR